MVAGVGPVFVTGGSSGIGFAVAVEAAAHGHPVALFARDPERLARAATALRLRFPGHRVLTFPLDVAEQEATAQVMAEAIALAGVPVRLVLSAGVTRPGLWQDVSPAEERRVMEVNYFGTLHVLRAVLHRMEPGAAIGFVGSAVGLFGIYGYGAYAPSKSALRALAEVLRVELAGRGIGVTMCMPPDTDTPMLAAERGMRPEVTSRMSEGLAVIPAEEVARHLWVAMARGRFLSLPGGGLRLMHLFLPWIAPFLMWKQRRLIARHAPGSVAPASAKRASGEVFAQDVDEHRGDAPDEETDRTNHPDGQQRAGIERGLR